MSWTSGAMGNTQPHNNMPPYYALLFIQKISATPTDYVTREEVKELIGEDGPSGGIGEVYSTEETRVGTWIDGKPLYRITYSGSVTGNQGVWLPLFKIENVKTITSMLGIFESEDQYNALPNRNVSLCFYNQMIQYAWYADGYFGNGNVSVSVEYTKTSD